MTCSITESTTPSIEILEATAGDVVIAEAQPCTITIDEANQPLITLQQPAEALVSVIPPAAASLTITQPSAAVTVLVSETGAVVTTFAQRDYLGATPTYVNGLLTEIAYSDGTSKQFTYDSSLKLIYVDYIAPNKTTLRKTLTWVDDQWTDTSEPEEI
jgi:hypothetical protein